MVMPNNNQKSHLPWRGALTAAPGQQVEKMASYPFTNAICGRTA
jgi:hypothetical protein